MQTPNPIGFDIYSHSGEPISLTKFNDKYNYFGFTKELADTIVNCFTPLVVGVYGRWGTGKTTILKTIEKIINEKENATDHYFFYKYSPWQYKLDDFEDVWISFISELEKQRNTPLGKALETVTKKAKWINICKRLGNLVSGYLTGGQPVFNQNEKSSYELVMDVKEAFQEGIKNTINKDEKKRVIIVIDDLDRCESNISVDVLRAIQLICRTPGCVFLLGMDREVIVNNLIQHYSNEDFAREYLDKIVQLHILLPEIDVGSIKNAILYDSKGSERVGFKDLSSDVMDMLAEILELNPRKVERFISLYDFKISEWRQRNRGRDLRLIDIRDIVMYGIIELRWPTLATVGRMTKNVLRAIDKVSTSWVNVEEVLTEYDYISGLEDFLKDNKLKRFYNVFYQEIRKHKNKGGTK